MCPAGVTAGVRRCRTAVRPGRTTQEVDLGPKAGGYGEARRPVRGDAGCGVMGWAHAGPWGTVAGA